MAFTIDDVRNKAKEWNITGISDADWALAEKNPDAGMSLITYKRDYMNAENDQARAIANAGAESIRKEYGGYSAGTDGSGYYLGPPQPNSFAPKETPSYSYDMESDPIYQAYAKQHAREGQRATQEAMAQAAALTGGMPSTAAVTAATQAGDYYAAQMADKVPELEQNAYARYLDRVSQNNFENQFAYQQHMDQQDHDAQKREEELEMAMLAAQYGDYSGLNKLGINIPEPVSGNGGLNGEPEDEDPETLFELNEDGWYVDIPTNPGTIARVQTMLGVTSDGEWGYESQQAAQAAGYRNFSELISDLMGTGGKTNESTESDKLSRRMQIEDLITSHSGLSRDGLVGLINGRGDLSKAERDYAMEIIRSIYGG